MVSMAILGLGITVELSVLLGFLNINSVGGQWASKPVVSSVRSDVHEASTCGGCTLYPATTDSAAFVGDPGATLPNSYVLFTAYGIKTTFLSQETCIISSGSQVLMESYYSINKPPNADPTAFQSSAYANFAAYLGFSTCAPGMNLVENIATNTVNLADSTLPSFGSVNPKSDASSRSMNSSNTLVSTTPSTITNTTTLPSRTLNRPSSGISTGAKATIGAVIPVIGIASLSLVTIYLWRKRKSNQPTKSKNHASDSSDDTQPYLQQKAELDSEERRQLELDAQELRYEMDGAVERYEIEGGDGSHEVAAENRRQGLLSLGQTHELRGEEHSKELEGPELL